MSRTMQHLELYAYAIKNYILTSADFQFLFKQTTQHPSKETKRFRIIS